jgi:hypothetical protein
MASAGMLKSSRGTSEDITWQGVAQRVSNNNDRIEVAGARAEPLPAKPRSAAKRYWTRLSISVEPSLFPKYRWFAWLGNSASQPL